MSMRGVSPTALRGRGAEVSGDDLPVVAVDAGGWQVQHDAPHRRLYPGAELQEVFAQGVDLSRPADGARGTPAQLFNPILDVTSGAVDRFVQMSGRVRKVRDHEARIVFGLATGMAHDFGL